MSVQWVETVGYGLYKTHPRRRERVMRITKTLIVTEFSRYNIATGLDVDLTNKSVGGYKLSNESLAALRGEVKVGGKQLPKVDPAAVAKALGAERIGKARHRPGR